MTSIPKELEQDADVLRFVGRFGEAIPGVVYFQGETTLLVDRESLLDVCRFAVEEEALQFNFLADVAGVDRLPETPRFEVNYHLLSLSRARRIRLKCRLPEEDPQIPSVTSVWATADWLEREVFDLFGIHFEGHPDLRRILCPEDWNGYPLRKDYPLFGYEETVPSPKAPTKRGWYSTLSD
ncbi:MAG: NADH-quinone oxidoreductase subunit C [Acidobacteriia bacterium]|nr:NADH-quinone oxidoreductase subunit C [Terriglobia bacterium]